MKKLLVLTVLVFSVLSAGCERKQTVNYPFDPAITGLATPIRLELFETNVVLEDYFIDISKIDSFTVPSYLTYKLTGNDFEYLTLVSTGTAVPPLGELKVWIDGFPYSIILMKNRKTNYTFQFDPQGKSYTSIQLAGSMNDWNPAANPLKLVDGKWQTTLVLNPGVYQYRLVIDGTWMADPTNTEKIGTDTGGYNSLLSVGVTKDEDLPFIHTLSANRTITIGYNKVPDNIFVLWENKRLSGNFVIKVENGYEITIPYDAKKLNRSAIRIWSYSQNSASNDLLIPISYDNVIKDAAALTRADKHATILYFMVLDRFKNGNPANDEPVDDPNIAHRANFQGGDIAGITKKIKDGYFTNLNINSIWFTPITQNPLKGFVEFPAPQRTYTGYHGYWPVSLTTIDHRFGNDAELHELVSVAHSHGINVILDYVSNHVHKENPLIINNPEWATDMVLPDGTINIRLWDEHRLTTWFDTFLPSLDFTIPEVVETMSDSALYWIEKFNLDGFRHDATKHIPTNYWRTLTTKIKQRFPDRTIYQIGETFGSRELIASYIGSGLMEGKFDFNLYFDARMVFATETHSFDMLNNSIQESFSYFGNHSLMGNITGNHDMPRFISFASGALSFDEDTKEAGWARQIEVKDPVGYNRLIQLLTFTMTIPGIPVIYYGDEIGMPGANDPDSRRMMRFENLGEKEQWVKETTKILNGLRRSNMEFLYGDFRTLHVETDTYAFARSYFDKIALVAFNKSNEVKEIVLEIPERFAGTGFTANFQSDFTLTGTQLKLTLNPNSVEVLTLPN